MTSIPESDDPHKVMCNCRYRCSRLPRGHDFVSKRSKQYHARKDAEGLLIDPRRLQHDAVAQGAYVFQPLGRSGSISAANVGLSRTQRWVTGRNLMQGALLGTSRNYGPEVASDRNDEFENTAPHDDEFENTTHPQSPNLAQPQTPDYSTHIRNEIHLTLDEAIYRETWRLQSLLDDSKVPIHVQDKILRTLFCPTDPSNLDDYRGMALGPLVRRAGSSWDGGPLGLPSLGTFGGLASAYQSMGAPQPEHWRMCLGTESNLHEALVLGPSDEDDVNPLTAPKCSCRDNASPRSLKRDCKICSERCTIDGCNLKRKEMLAFDYLPIGPILKKLFASRSVCHEMLTMWREQARWLHPTAGHDEPIREWWDGSKAKEISWFWDPCASFELPVLCRECYNCYQTFPHRCDILKESMATEDGVLCYEFDCAHCGNHMKTSPTYSQGDPRNIALMAHWDGFQSARSSYRSTWTVEISFLNMGVRCDKLPIPVLFIPHSQTEKLTKQKFNNLDAFLEPFIRDLQTAYVDGVVCEFQYPLELIHHRCSTSTFCCRVRLCVFTGDHPAQCKFGGWCIKGYAACRRCHMTGKWKRQSNPASRRGSGGQVVYGDNRYLGRHPPAKRDLATTRHAADSLEGCTVRTERVHLTQESGISHKTKAWRLFDTFGFCLINDLVFDVMHVLALNLFKTYVENLMHNLSSSEKRILEQALVEVTAKKPKALDGRWPKDPINRLGYFKAEEYARFILYCLPHILYKLDIGPETKLGIFGMLLTEIGRLFYIQSRQEGWRKSTVDKACTLLASWRVRNEEAFGENGSILEHVAGSGELLDDIRRHGPHWGFWCYRFERMVSGYARTTTNNKEKELTYTSYHARLFFTKTSMLIWKDDDGFLPHQRALLAAHKHLRLTRMQEQEHSARDERDLSCPPWHDKCRVVVSSQDQALDLWKNISPSPENSYCRTSILHRGIGVGRVLGRVKKVDINNDIRNFLELYWAKQGGLTDYNRAAMVLKVIPIKSVVIRGSLFRPGDHVIVLTDEEDDSTYCWNWRAVITRFFSHEFMGSQELFFEARWFGMQRTTDNPPRMVTDLHSGMSVLYTTPESYDSNNCRAVSRLLHKFIPISRVQVSVNGRSSSEMVCLELEDRSKREHLENNLLHICPTYPYVQDIVQVRLPQGTRLAVVRDIDQRSEGDGPLPGSLGSQVRDVNMADWNDGGDGGEEAMENEEQSFPDHEPSAGDLYLGVSWVNKIQSRASNGLPRCDEWKASESTNIRVVVKEVEGLVHGVEVISNGRHGTPVRWAFRAP